jgi:hypothetical protein
MRATPHGLFVNAADIRAAPAALLHAYTFAGKVLR